MGFNLLTLCAIICSSFNPRYMDTSLYLAQLMGLSLVAMGLAFLLNRNLLKTILDDFFKSPALMYVTGLLIFVVGLAMIYAHNIWDGLWYQTLITILAWLTFLKGVMYIVFPQVMVNISKSLVNTGWMKFGMIFALVLGLVLLYAGVM